MSKTFLAFKAVGPNGKSTWIKHPLLQTYYAVGKRVRVKNKHYPFYIATVDEIIATDIYAPNTRKHGRKLRVSAPYDSILVIRVQARDVVDTGVPFLSSLNERNRNDTDLDGLLSGADYNRRKFMGALALTPIAQVPAGAALYPFIKDLAKKHKIPLLRNTRDLGQNPPPLNKTFL